MSFIIIALVAFVASCLTFFSGFGLGTILMPAFLLFFPLDAAIAMTAVVHLLNNLLKLAILWKAARWDIIRSFGVPAVIFAFVGASLLLWMDNMTPLYMYQWLGRDLYISIEKLTIAVLIFLFVVLESLPALKNFSFPPRYLPVGGALSGFFGGLSGHQGALRSMFLLKCNLNKESYVATGVVIACLVDFSRLSIYGKDLLTISYKDHAGLMAVAVVAAFAGVFAGSRLLKKITMNAVQWVVSGMLIVIAILLGSGII